MSKYANIARRITTSDGANNVNAVFWATLTDEPITLRLYNDSDAAANTNYLTAVRGDLIESGYSIPAETEATKNGLGEELVNETWLEARLGTSGDWTPLDSWSNKLDLGAIAAGSYATFQLRLNAASSYDSTGMIAFALRVLSAEFEILLNESFQSFSTGTFFGDGVPTGFANLSGAILGGEVVGISEQTGPDATTIKVFEIENAQAATTWQFAPDPALVLDDDFFIETWVNPFSGGQSAVIGTHHATAGFREYHCGVIFSFSPAKICAMVGGDPGNLTPLADWASEQWYKIKIKVNLTSNTFDVWIDGLKCGSDIACRAGQTPYNVIFGNGNVGLQKAYFYNMKVLKGV